MTIDSVSYRVFSWKDTENSGATGWIVIHNIANGISGGGLFMHENASLQEVKDLARTMSYKNSLQIPVFGGGKAGIKFNPKNPEAKQVLTRFLRDNISIIQNLWCTGGDLNTTTQIITQIIGKISKISTPFYCLAKLIEKQYNKKINLDLFQQRLNNLDNPFFSIEETITGWSVLKTIQRMLPKNKEYIPKIIVQGLGKIGKAVCYSSQHHVKVVGIIESDWFVYNPAGLDVNHILSLSKIDYKTLQNFKPVVRSIKESDEDFLIRFLKLNESIEIFCPCAIRYVITEKVLEILIRKNIKTTVHVIAGANDVFLSRNLIYRAINNNICVIPEWISNCGSAVLFVEALKNQANAQEWNTTIKKIVEQRITGFIDSAEALAKEKKMNFYDSCHYLAQKNKEF